MKVRRTLWLTGTALAVCLVAGTVVAHELPAARAADERAARVDQWRRAAITARSRRIAAIHQRSALRDRYNALVRRSRRHDAGLVHVLANVRKAKLRAWSGQR